MKRSFHALRAAFSTAVLVACRDDGSGGSKPPPPPPPTVPTTATATTPTITRTSLPPTQKRFGQRCAGAMVAALKPKVPVDYLELRMDYYVGAPGSHEIVSTGQTGTPCATAKDAAKCKASLEAAALPSGAIGEYLVYTRGDEVGVVHGKDVVPFLAPIDSAEEAAFALVLPLAAETSAAAVLAECDAGKFTKTNAGWETTHVRTSFCDERHETTYLVAADGTSKTTKQVDVPAKDDCQRPFLGRRPEGACLSTDGATVESVGEFFVECTEMEAASVHSFERLAAELSELGAPRTLVRRARRAADDERRHARTMRSLAARNGRRAPRVARPRFAPRRAVEVALENAVEGCVNETWAALVATFQASRASDPVVRRAMGGVAVDETRHAALARDVAAWLDTRLTVRERREVRTARAKALADLRAKSHGVPTTIQGPCGMPGEREVRGLLHAFSGLLRSEMRVSASR